MSARKRCPFCGYVHHTREYGTLVPVRPDVIDLGNRVVQGWVESA